MTDEKTHSELVDSKDVEKRVDPSKLEPPIDDPDEGLSDEEKAKIVLL